jgi:hypothetical protein
MVDPAATASKMDVMWSSLIYVEFHGLAAELQLDLTIGSLLNEMEMDIHS